MIKPTTQAYSELQTAYDFFNEHLFDSMLPVCLITLQRDKRTYGFFSNAQFVNSDGKKTDEIAMNPSYFSIRSIPDTLSTLVHEMVHLWQQHFAKPGRRGYHNKEWAEKMEEVGLPSSDTGKEGGKRTGERMSHYILEGGAFDLVCKKLLTQEFTLSWFDRFPPYTPDKTVNKIVSTGEYEDEKEGDEGEESVNDEFAALTEIGIEIPTEPKNRSNRLKYRCNGCNSQVWGKPGLSIVCGECDEGFEAVE